MRRRRAGEGRERAGDAERRSGAWEELGRECEHLARLVAVAGGHRLEERVALAHEERRSAVPVAPPLVGGEFCLAVGHRLEKPHLVDEGQQHDRLPRELLAW